MPTLDKILELFFQLHFFMSEIMRDYSEIFKSSYVIIDIWSGVISTVQLVEPVSIEFVWRVLNDVLIMMKWKPGVLASLSRLIE